MTRHFFYVTVFSIVAVSPSIFVGLPAPANGDEFDASKVSVEEDPESFMLSNGIVSAQVLKRNGDILSLKHKGVELFTGRSGHAGGYWSHDTTSGKGLVTRVTIDPQTNH